MIELTSDPLSEAARQGCATLRELAGRTQAIIGAGPLSVG